MSKKPRYEERSEYGGGDGGDYLTSPGTPRQLSAGIRAWLLRREMQGSEGSWENGDATFSPEARLDPGSEQVVPGFRR
jgi:DNA-binding response OmpR family regulator